MTRTRASNRTWRRLTAVSLASFAAAISGPSACGESTTRVVIGIAREPVVAVVAAPRAVAIESLATDGDAVRRAVLAAARQTAIENEGRMIVVRIAEPPLDFGRLDAESASTVRALCGEDDPGAWYERAMDRALLAAVADLHEGGLSRVTVSNLPVERAARGDGLPDQVNDHYAGLVGALDALLSHRTLILSASTPEHIMLPRTLPRMLAASAGRPVFYQANATWRILLPDSEAATIDRWRSELLTLESGELLLEELDVIPTPLARAGDRDAAEPETAGSRHASSGGATRGSTGGASAPGADRGSGGGGGGGRSTSSGGDAGSRDTDGTPAPSGPTRLLQFQLVGHTSLTQPGRVAKSVCSPTDGWSTYVDGTLRPLVNRLGPGSFNWWGHWVAGVYPTPVTETNRLEERKMLFECVAIARQQNPKILRYGPLAQYAAANGMKLYGYIGTPLCYGDEPEIPNFVPQPHHCDPDRMDEWYGEFIAYGFKGIGHDWAQHLNADAGALDVNFPYLRDRGLEVLIESMPLRVDPHLLGLSVVVTEARLLVTQRRPAEFFSVDEIRQAGGRIVIIVSHPSPEFTGDRYQWRFEHAKARLEEGHYVAVDLHVLAREGYPIEQLVAAARN